MSGDTNTNTNVIAGIIMLVFLLVLFSTKLSLYLKLDDKQKKIYDYDPWTIRIIINGSNVTVEWWYFGVLDKCDSYARKYFTIYLVPPLNSTFRFDRVFFLSVTSSNDISSAFGVPVNNK